ncbi:MAG: DUF1573 domain-containing protein [Bacteroidales bacterium]
MKRVLTILYFLSAVVGLNNIYAQFAEPSITFSTTSHNFGTLNELDGIKTHTFEFFNNGGQALVLTDVVTSCGCTVPEWSKAPVAPGGKGSLTVSFDPKGSPGAFRKSITVKSNAREGAATLYIVGLVNARPKSVADDFPVQMGKIRLATNHVSMQKVYKGQAKLSKLEIYNDSDSVVTVAFPNPPAPLSFRVIPASLEPKQKASVEITYDGSKSTDWGFTLLRVNPSFNGQLFRENPLNISATLEEDFSTLSAEALERAPKATLSEDSFNFGTITPGQKITHDFILKNEGTDPLIIRKVSTTCGCTASVPDKYEIPGGDQTVIKSTFDSRGKAGKQFQTITLIVNDPVKPTQVIRLIGSVESAGK